MITQRIHRRTVSGLLVFGLVLVGLLIVQEAMGQIENQLGVYEAIELARTRSPIVNQVREEIRLKEGEKWTSFGIYAPEVTFFREGIPTGTGGGFAEQRWMISQSIDFPLQSYYRLRRVGTEQDALGLRFDAEAARLASTVKEVYTDLLYMQELVHLRKEEVRLGEQLVEAALVRVEVGEASELELMKAEVQLTEAQSSLADAQRQFQNERYTLFNVVGLDPEAQRYEIIFPDTLVYIDVLIDQRRVLAMLDRQPELLSAAKGFDAARLGIKQAKSSLMPALTFDFYAQDYGTGYDQYGFQVGLKIPLWVVPNYKGRLQRAKAEAQTWQWRHEAVRLDLKKQAEQAWHSYETSKQTIDRYRRVVQARSEELLNLTLEGYRIGELDLLTLLDTQRTYLASQQRYYDALRDYYHQLIDLERFLGEDIVFNPAYVVTH